MCGLVGFIDFTKNTSIEILKAMTKTLVHRGPDDSGFQIFETEFAKVGLGHTRLSIIDLSKAAHQPMSFGNYWIIFNGEIYNYKEIRAELINIGHKFSTNSDTEVILHAYAQWNTRAVNKFIGMFVIVIYDTNNNELTIFRDRAGVKPFYYYFDNNVFLFSSELKSFHIHPKFNRQIDFKSLRNYFDLGYIPAPYSIFEKTNKLKAGNYLRFFIKKKKYNIESYWLASEFYNKSKLQISYNESKNELKSLLKNAFRYRLVSDVPLGIFLSGGYDSSLVTALLQGEMSDKLKTFTIGFEEGNNEAPYAREIANYLGTDHHEFICTTKEAKDIIPSLPYYFDEPFADSSAIPTILVSRLARDYVKVILSADGGDELFGGYDSYLLFEKYSHLLNLIPPSLKGVFSKFLNAIVKFPLIGTPELIHKIISVAKSLDKDENLQGFRLFKQMNSLPDYYHNNLFNKNYEFYKSKYDFDPINKISNLENILLIDFLNYLPNDILTKVDRATMSVSLEGREPLLDHRIFEFAAQLPIEYKIKNGQGKIITKDIVHELIPFKMMLRPKSGFSIPLKSWLKNDLSYLFSEYLSKDALKKTGIFNHQFVIKQLELFLNDKLHYTPLVWRLLMFQMWYNKWV